MESIAADILSGLVETVDALIQQRLASLRVGQNELWLGLEPAETRAILDHFTDPATGRAQDFRCASSASREALALRNRGGAPPRLLLVIDEPWRAEAQDARQSLQDLSRRDALQLLATPITLPMETKWLSRVADNDTRSWIQALFRVLRGQIPSATIRDRDDLPMRMSLSRYLTYLVDTFAELPQVTPQAALGTGLWRLGLFSHQTLVERVPPRHDSVVAIASRLATTLTQNFRSAHDPDELAERLSSPQRTAVDVLGRFRDSGYRLAVSDDNDSHATAALEDFLSREDLSTARRLVEWEFFYRPAGQRAGRGRRGGLRALLAYREALADRREQLRERFLARATPDRREDLRREVEMISDLGRGTASRVALEQLERRARELWSDDPKELDRVLNEMQRIHRKARGDRTFKRVDNILEALVDVAISERPNGAAAHNDRASWGITFPHHDDSLQLPPVHDITAWKIFLESSHRTLRRVFSNQWDEIKDTLDDDVPDHVEVEFEIRTDRASYLYLLSESTAWTTGELRSLLGAARLVADSEEGDISDLLTSARPARIAAEALSGLCGQLHDLAQQLDPSGPFCLDSVASVIRAYAQVLEEAVAGRKAALLAERDALRESAKLARAAGKPSDEVVSLYERAAGLDEQIASLPEAEWTDQQARDLGRLQTILPARADDPARAERGPERAWLMPLHPLILRARYAQDRIYLEALQQLLNPAVVLDDTRVRLMEAFLDDCGQSPPSEVFCPWTTAHSWPPLRFQRYVQGFAEFGTPAITQADYGRSSVVRAMTDYLSLYGAARDRLVLYLEADNDGRAAYHFATALMAVGEDGDSIAHGIDLLLLAADRHRYTYLEHHAAAREGLDDSLFGIARGALRPRVTFRRAVAPGPPRSESAHVAVVYTGRDRHGVQPLLRGEPRWLPPELAALADDPLDPGALFAPLPLQETDAFLRMWTARDVLSLRWEGLMARLHVNQPGTAFVTEVNLAPEQNAVALRALHDAADWVILLSELPVHRAIEAARDTGAQLIDRKNFLERGREYSLSVSTSHTEVLQGLLRRAVTEVLGKAPSSTDELLRFLRAFAPGLAMRYAGRPEEMGPRGILGLLLTAATARATIPGAFVIPLDEHPWLYGRSGIRADVLTAWPGDQTLNLKVMEAKYLASPSEPELARARQQVARTSSILEAWATSPAMQAYFRRRLYDALLPWRHDPLTRDTVRPLFPIVLNQRIPIQIHRPPEVHVWISATDSRGVERTVDDVLAVIHSLGETREALGRLCSLR